MKTQISRQSFAEQKRYSGVYQQMGRMITDADWNELSDLLQFEVADAMEDVIGSGTPARRGLVHKTPSGEFALRWGYLYADGLRGKVVPREASAPANLVFTEQADFPDVPPLPAGEHRLYVDVWERTVTHLEDRALLDSALKGADTCTRTQRMAQVKACALDISAEQLLDSDGPVNPSHGRLKLSVELNAGETLPDPCDPCADELALKDDVGNFLFRVEVHEALWDRSGSEPVLTELWLKWSSENGAEHYQVGVTPPGFTAGGFVYEFFSAPDQQMATEKHLGHHLQAGFTPQRGVLKTDHTDEPAGLGLIRRWDGYIRLVKEAGAWTLAEGWDRGRALSTGYGSNAHGYVDLGGPVHISLDAVALDIELGDEIAVPGDHWLAAVRQAEHQAGDLLLDEALPEGIVHHYVVLGTVEVGEDGSIEVFTPDAEHGCKAFDFPPLTDLKARDVCYDNDHCDMPQVRTVQDAIDYLCKARDLRWHHKHLHGMGVVCGLIVECGPDTLPDLETGEAARRQVTVTRGSALDCEGNIIELEQTRHFDVMAALEPLLEETPDVLNDGSGTLCLWIETGEGGEPVLKLEPYEKQGNNAWLDGTIWMDFYQHCIKDLVDEFQSIMEELSQNDADEEENDTGEWVSSRRKESTALLNLVAQLLYRPQGQWVFLSEREHVLLRTFYVRLRELVQSKTFCGMSAGQPFPEYPFTGERATDIQTAFGKHHHEQVLVHPQGSHTLTYGGTDTTINVYDNRKDKVIHISTVKAGEGAQVTAMAFDPSGELVYAATAINAEDSLLNRGRFNDGKIEWENSVVLCGVEATDLQFLPDDKQRLFMLGLGKGLYRLNLQELFGEDKVVPEPQWRFNAVGPITYDLDSHRAYATGRSVGTNAPDGVFDGIAEIDLKQTPDGDDRFVLNALFDPEGNPIQGTDTVTWQPGRNDQPAQLHVVVQDGTNAKSVYSYRLPLSGEPRGPIHGIDGLEHSEIDLLYHPQRDELMISIQDEFRIITVNAGKVQHQWVPVQLMPIAMALEAETDRLVVLNYMSNTLTLYPVNEIDGSKREALAQYRLEIVLAFMSLLGNLLQYLKDCFCHLLLIKCPQCDQDDKIYLARIDVRNNKVYKVCNFGKRKNVWTFPKFEYWLSIIPILPMLKKGIGEFCCMVMPNLFGNLMENYQPDQPSGFAVKGSTYRKGVTRTKTANPKRSWRETKDDMKVNVRLAGDSVLNRDPKQQRASVSKQAYRNLEIHEAVKALEMNDVKVDGIVKYNAKDAPNALRRHALTPDRIEKGSEVVIYEEDGKAAFYALKQPDIPGFNTALAEEEMTQLRVEKDQLVTEIRRAESQLHALKVERTQSEVAVQTLKEQFQSLEQQRGQVMADMQAMRTGVQSLEQEVTTLKIDMAKARPVKDIADVSSDDEIKMKDTGFRNLGELAEADIDLFSQRTGIEKTRAQQIIASARNMLEIKPR
ncbi:DUF6519 domain-containing protein [Halomonas urumqiensis]|uniref:Uncharacterized protein n=1 Tax=Halomonas urumqiensis TaxID=1684789 RepID=A0A2N7UCX3_9GAMM|nr:DUF6519 domain-containing protein [Halomonas urumqiensis]PMR78308.1 hypothetical protein C1H70_16240 [Halomonas urumqiensis]PTB03455.1 hypothetical protein C6V82_02875 [Halomonas urumqiensis]GHE20360.1 hypothetical protein GCM10017767_08810 [Halomonas urumqiensis]